MIMELLELENIWKECDSKITENNLLNKEILRRILVNKPERKISWMKIRTLCNLFSPLVILIWLSFTKFQFNISMSFYIGLGLFLPVFILTYIWDWKYFTQIHHLDLTDATLNIKQCVARLEKYKLKVTQIRYMLMPIAITGLLFIFCQNFIFNIEFIVMILLIILVFFMSAYYRFKYSIKERFRILNKEIDEIEKLKMQ